MILFPLLFTIITHAAPMNPPAHNPPYPAHWWTSVSKVGAPSWEILPQEAKYGEVILSKRNELGLLSNFAATPFTYHGKRYASVEGFWQGTKYPDNDKDWPHTRAEVEAMTAFEAKHAGDQASAMMKKQGIDWVTFEGKKYVYKEKGDSEFYKLIKEVMTAKLEQNPSVEKVLMQTDDLKLMPDHHDNDAPALKAWQYYSIWTELRDKKKCSSDCKN